MSGEHTAMVLKTAAAHTNNNTTELVWARTKILQDTAMFERIYVCF